MGSRGIWLCGLMMISWLAASVPAVAQERLEDFLRQLRDQLERRNQEGRYGQPRLVPLDPQTEGPRRWRLGVNIRNLETGVQITEVFPGGSAERHGIEAGDVLITVNGHQIGNVLGREIDIADAFEQSADAQGRVVFLIRDQRTSTLQNRLVRLTPRAGNVVVERPVPVPVVGRIRGSVGYREKALLPINTIVEVQLIDVSRQNVRPPVVARSQMKVSGQVPVPFELTFNGDDLDPQKDYAIDARISVGGEVRWVTSTPTLVITKNRPKTADLILDPVR